MEFSVLIATVQAGPYIAWWKLLIGVIVLLAWARLLTWVDKDSPTARLPRHIVNAALCGGMVLAFLLYLLPMPSFSAALGLLLGILAVEIGTYLGIRHQQIGLADLTKQFQGWIHGFRGEKAQVVAKAGEVMVYNKSGNPLPAPDAESPERRPYDAAQELLTGPLLREAERVEVVPGETAAVGYFVDGVRYDVDPMDRGAAASAITYLKQAAGMDVNEKRKPQTGSVRIAVGAKRRDFQIKTAGSSAGESLVLASDPRKSHEFTIDTLGLNEDQAQLVKDVVADNSGIVLVSSPKGQGLTSLIYAIMRGHDAFLSHIHTVERAPDMDLEGITQNALPAVATGTEEAKMVGWVISQDPDVVVVTQMEDPRSAAEAVKFAAGGKRIYIGMHAGNTFDTLSVWRKLVGDDGLALKNLKLIVSGRVIRCLCSACKIGYSPDPNQLKKLNMDPQRVGKLYQARTTPMKDAKGNPVPCTFCHDLAYKGRVGVYELLTVDDEVRQVVQSGGSLNQLKAIFRKQKGRYLQEMALAQVEAGDTSVQEVLRVLKSDGAASSAGPGRTPPGRSSAPPQPAR